VRVIVNAECTYLTRAGIGHHTSELLGALRARTDPDAIGEYPSGAFVPVVRFFNHHHDRYQQAAERPGVLARAEALTRGGYLGALKLARNVLVPNPLARCARRGAYDLYHEPNFLAHPCDLPTVVTVHDLSVLLHPEWHPARRVAKFRREFERTLRQARHLLTVSAAMRDEIVSALGWPAERVTVTYNGRRPFLRPLSAAECAPTLLRLGLSPGYLLHVGTVEPRKNIGMLLKAHAGLPPALRQRHPLVLVGGSGWSANDLENELEAHARDGSVRRLGYCADEDLSALYSSARALVFPTLYEGFGMPTVEMLACGGAVLASTASAVAETVGGAAHLIDPHDQDAWRDALLRACTDEHWLNELRVGAVEAARPFTWDRCAAQTLEAYRTVLGSLNEVKRAA
jgi:glycosyltransferase involved in cell wall biosynthesis